MGLRSSPSSTANSLGGLPPEPRASETVAAFLRRWIEVARPRPLLHVRHSLLRPPGGPWQLQEPKSRTSRRDVHLVAPAVAALRAQRDRQAFERSSAGLDRTHRPHDLRHSCATYLLAAGVSEKEIMDILGHTNLAMTRHYEHVLDGMRAAAADRLETWFGAHIGAAEAP
jgi:integrase